MLASEPASGALEGHRRIMIDDTAYGTRNARGEWAPNHRVDYSPLFHWPLRPARILRWFVTGYVLSFNALYLAVALAAWWVATPSRDTMASLGVGWIAVVLIRNAAILVAWYGLFHLQLYRRRAQADRFKYNARFPAERSSRFTFGSQTRDNVFWTLASGLPIWTAWEVLTLWLMARGTIPWIGWNEHPVWFVALLVLIPLWREVHFYTVHRMIHWPPLYKAVHSLHHRNTNPIPWSGMSMHPVEHLLYFSAIAIHWIVPSHPIHAMYTSFHLMMAPVPGHTGFDRVEVGDRSFATHCYAHYLHHKYFEVNYSDGALPLDAWFGSFHDGSPEADAAMKARRRSARASVTAGVD
jgi:sterol desaturase/sphingolipid hydroxylase (fatty acid hydroxylase superfamily)